MSNGTLFIVATPIGNLSDFSPRGIRVLSEVDLIAAEDTRVSGKLLSHFGIKKPMLSYYKHNENIRGEGIISRLTGGENIALISDAGMPLISDPGYVLVEKCYEMGIKVEVIPGCNAAIAALAVSGQDTGRFSFEGFLTVNKKGRKEHLNEIKNQRQTLIFYEAPHKLIYTLQDLLEILGDRQISVCRELTKIHEEVIRGKISNMIELFSEKTPKGEFVLVVEGCKDEKETVSFEQAVELAAELIDGGMKTTDACKIISKQTGYSKSILYKKFIGDN